MFVLERRHYLSLPAFSLATVLLMLASVEGVARKAYQATKSDEAECLVMNDPTTGVRGIPNAICRQKTFEESQATEYRFNRCGDRSSIQCGPRPQGTFRVVLEGTSMAVGLRVPEEETFAALLSKTLVPPHGYRRVEVYNESLQWHTPKVVDMRFQNVLNAQPNLVLWTLTEWDLRHASELLPGHTEAPANSVRWWARGNILDSAHRFLLLKLEENSMAFRWSEHFMNEDQTFFVKQYLSNSAGTGFLKVNSDAIWQRNLKHFENYFTNIEARAQEAGTPLVVTVLPDRAQAALISMGEWPSDIDPYKLGKDVRSIVERHQGIYVDILHDFQGVTDASKGYYPFDGHPNRDGHARIALFLARALSNGSVEALTVSGR